MSFNEEYFRKKYVCYKTTRLILFTVIFRKLKLLSIYVFSYFPFVFEGRMLDLIVSIPDHCLTFYLTMFKFSAGQLVI